MSRQQQMASSVVRHVGKAAVGSLFLVLAPNAFAVPVTLTYDSRAETKTWGTPLTAGSEIHLDGLVRSAGGSSLTQEFVFRAGSTAMSLSAGWLTGPPANRTVGVNIDLFDGLNNLQASDVFLGVNGELASSQLTASNLIAGAQYRLVLTGTAIGAGRYRIDMVDGATPPPLAPLAAATPAEDRALFDTHQGTKTFTDRFSLGDTLQIDGVLPDDRFSSISNDFKFVLDTPTLSGGIEWITGALGDPQRTIGVNVDLFDQFSNLAASDVFKGVFDGQAFSTLLATGLTPGAYTLKFTGTAELGGRYRITLGTSPTPPGFEPIDDRGPPVSVPEPAPLSLLAIGLVALLAQRAARERKAKRHR